ncbi:MAG: YebC/PmpR family DNA-binding transcriptional regulator [Gammaproteobacteria bacterium]|nr:YebC/PmpR family DNA-binding transcriptional regulator [Gammaproteobacteria bacterium]MCI0590781.1 YebC/PmpR family DNA-binding transcriptional regulator [Gammaproteobacteria bacterium]
MAGHSKWANIQHRKGRKDAKRGKLFTKRIREITVAARLGGGDASANPRLRAAIDNALSNNLSKDTIERAITKGLGASNTDNLEEVRYEGYGPGGVAVMVDCMTDNRKRTVADVRHAFGKSGGGLGTDGSVAYLFTKVGLLTYAAGVDEDVLMELALEAGAEDVVSNEDGTYDVLTAPNRFGAVKDAIASAGFKLEVAEVTMRSTTTHTLDLDGAQKMVRLFEMLEDLDDVQKVYSNAEIPDAVLAKLS